MACGRRVDQGASDIRWARVSDRRMERSDPTRRPLAIPSTRRRVTSKTLRGARPPSRGTQPLLIEHEATNTPSTINTSTKGAVVPAPPPWMLVPMTCSQPTSNPRRSTLCHNAERCNRDTTMARSLSTDRGELDEPHPGWRSYRNAAPPFLRGATSDRRMPSSQKCNAHVDR